MSIQINVNFAAGAVQKYSRRRETRFRFLKDRIIRESFR
jgi:hypothetical protein